MLDYKIAGSVIASYRKKNGLSQERLAELLNISPQAISKWENGHSLPDTALLPVLSQIFECTIDELIMPAFLSDAKIEEEKPNMIQLQAEQIAKCVLQQLEKGKKSDQTAGLDDKTIIRAISKTNPNLGNYTFSRNPQEKEPRYEDTYIKVSTPQKDYPLLQRIFSGDDKELLGYNLLKSRTFSIPHIYLINIAARTVLMEDLSESYIQGFYYNENNENGAVIRNNYSHLLKATAEMHADFWEDKTVFEQIGLDWRHQTAENLLAHISGMEADFQNYKEKEINHRIPERWECFVNHFDIKKLDCFQDAARYLKQNCATVLERFHTGSNVTVIHGDLHPGNVFMAKTPDRTVKFIDLQAVRIGLCTEDLAMLLALHIQPDNKLAKPLIDDYYNELSMTVKNYSYETFLSDLKYSVAESMFFPIQLINRGIYDFSMRDKAIKAYETFLLSDY